MNSPAFDDRLGHHKTKLQRVAAIGIMADTAINTAFVYNSMTVSGGGLTAILTCLVFALFWFNAVYWATSFGIDLLSSAEEDKKKKVMPLWTGFMASVLAVSVYMSGNFLALDLAENEYLQDTIYSVFEVESKVSKTHASTMNLETVFETSSSKATVMKELEVTQGGISGLSGIGEVASLLASLDDVTALSRKQLVQANGVAEPIKREIDELKEDIRRVSSREDLNYREKTQMLKEKIELLSLAIKHLQQSLPISTITNAIDAMGRDFKASGINDQASQRLTAAFRPVSTRLSRELGGLKEANRLDVPSIKNLSDYELLSRSDDAIPLLVIALILASMPLGLSFCVFLISPNNPPQKELYAKKYEGDDLSEQTPSVEAPAPLRMKANVTKH
jgi:hypothetical protein